MVSFRPCGLMRITAFFRLERSVDRAASEEEHAGPQQAENRSQQALSEPLESRWLKYMDKGCEDQELDRGRAAPKIQPSASAEWPGLPCSPARTRKRCQVHLAIPMPTLTPWGGGSSEQLLEVTKWYSRVVLQWVDKVVLTIRLHAAWQREQGAG
ncbi:UPF0544 protein C5orf45-like [Cricetulus griseus]|uniref:UPF0544 protein C5orf45-like n=1 Tax=Cricetulus griseus TaxID=10029 RepID=G3HP62_CRIGR|nr:UPF0544 protein C5orf45-like [Cricetulus griseus]